MRQFGLWEHRHFVILSKVYPQSRTYSAFDQWIKVGPVERTGYCDAPRLNEQVESTPRLTRKGGIDRRHTRLNEARLVATDIKRAGAIDPSCSGLMPPVDVWKEEEREEEEQEESEKMEEQQEESEEE